jgi:hypothetical protein
LVWGCGGRVAPPSDPVGLSEYEIRQLEIRASIVATIPGVKASERYAREALSISQLPDRLMTVLPDGREDARFELRLSDDSTGLSGRDGLAFQFQTEI